MASQGESPLLAELAVDESVLALRLAYDPFSTRTRKLVLETAVGTRVGLNFSDPNLKVKVIPLTQCCRRTYVGDSSGWLVCSYCDEEKFEAASVAIENYCQFELGRNNLLEWLKGEVDPLLSLLLADRIHDVLTRFFREVEQVTKGWEAPSATSLQQYSEKDIRIEKLCKDYSN